MNSFSEDKDALIEKIEQYLKTSLDILKLNSVEKSAEIISSIITGVLLFILFVLFTLFINIGLSLFIGKLLNNNYLGFLILSLFYLILGIFLYIFRHQLVKSPISNLIISKLLIKFDLDEIIKSENQLNIEEDDTDSKAK